MPGRWMSLTLISRCEICLRDDLDALGQEVLDEAHQGHARAMDVAHTDLAARGQRFRELLELELLLLILEQSRRAQRLHACSVSPVRGFTGLGDGVDGLPAGLDRTQAVDSRTPALARDALF